MAGRQDIFDQAMRQGHSAAWDQQWDRAIAAYRKAIQEFPDNQGALTSLGLALYQAGQFDEALTAYQRTIQLVPNDSLALEKAADTLERLGRLEESAAQYFAAAEVHLGRRDVAKAIENWERSARLAPTQLAVHSRLALAYERTGSAKQAIPEYIAIARLLQRQGDHAKAFQAAQRALQLDPRNPEAAQAMKAVKEGVPLPEPPKPKGSTGPMRMAKVQEYISPDATESSGAGIAAGGIIETAQKKALATLAGLLFDESNDDAPAPPSAGLAALTRGLTGAMRQGRNDRTKVILHLGQAIDQHTQGKPLEAIAEYERAIAAGLEHAAAQFNLGSLQLAQGDPDSALALLRGSVNHPDYALASQYAVGRIHVQAGKYKDALLHFLQALRLADLQTVTPPRAEALSQLYETMADAVANAAETPESKDIAEALHRFLDGPDWATRLAQARSQLDSQSDGRAASPLAELMFTAGTDRVVGAMGRIDEYLRKGYSGTAMEEAYMALEYAPTYLPIHIRMAEILLEENRLEASIAKYSVVAEAYRIRGESVRAAMILEEVIRLSPMNLETRRKLIDLLVETEQHDQALGQYMDLAETYYQLADLDQARQTYVTALRLAQRAKGDRAWSTQFLHRMGDIDLQRLDWRQALRVYEQIKTLAPNDDKARSALLDLNLRLGQSRQAVAELDDYLRHLLGAGRIDQAVGVLEELARGRPNEMAFRARLAKLYQDRGRKADAIAQLDALGELQLEAGLNAEAAATIRSILALGPDDAAAYRQLLSQLGP